MIYLMYERVQSELDQARNSISNYNQSQYLLNQMGRYVAYAGSGSAASGTEAIIQH